MKLLLPYQRKRIHSTERHIENLRDRVTRAQLDFAWKWRADAVIHAMMLAEARRRRDGLDRLAADIRALDGEWVEPEWSRRVDQDAA